MVSFGIYHTTVACRSCVCCLLSITPAELLHQVCQRRLLYPFTVTVRELDSLLKLTREWHDGKQKEAGEKMRMSAAASSQF